MVTSHGIKQTLRAFLCCTSVMEQKEEESYAAETSTSNFIRLAVLAQIYFLKESSFFFEHNMNLSKFSIDS